MGEIEELKARIAELTEELAVTDKLLNERNRVMDAIPPCSDHGSQCVPHAIEWVMTMRVREGRRAKELAGEKVESGD